MKFDIDPKFIWRNKGDIFEFVMGTLLVTLVVLVTVFLALLIVGFTIHCMVTGFR